MGSDILFLLLLLVAGLGLMIVPQLESPLLGQAHTVGVGLLKLVKQLGQHSVIVDPLPLLQLPEMLLGQVDQGGKHPAGGSGGGIEILCSKLQDIMA